MITMISKAVMVYEDLYLKVLPTGSKVIIAPEDQEAHPPQDEDYLLLVSPEQRHTLESQLIQHGWELGGSLPNHVTLYGEPPEDWVLNTEHEFLDHGSIDSRRLFHSWKRQENISTELSPLINLLITCNEQYFNDFTRATFLSKSLNLTNKHDRVTVFEALCMDRWPSGRKTGRHPR